ncbi:MAG: trypsin-like peptidase domain-containing protein [Saprospiraceae bacterium]
MKKLNLLFAGVLILIGGIWSGIWYSNQINDNGYDRLEVLTDYQSKQQVKTQVPKSKREIDPVTTVTDIETATIQLFEDVSPAVCFINTSKVSQDYWNRSITERPSGSGSGFVWDVNGHIVTNFHVIQGASKITITLSDMSSWDAEVVGLEPNKDLAVLRINAPKNILTAIKIGSSDDLKVGQSVFAIGNPFGLDYTLTTGIISALGREIKSVTGRPIKDVIQTDAAINPGNSGGPLLDASGRLIGVNTMIYSPSGASAGIGFSIPVDEVNWVVSDLVKYGELRRPVLGVSLVSSQYMRQTGMIGALILEVTEGSPASAVGLHPTERNRNGRIELGDLIVGINDDIIKSNNDLFLAIEKYAPGDKITVIFKRNGRDKAVELVLDSSFKI